MTNQRLQFSLGSLLLISMVAPALAFPFAIWSWPIATVVLGCLNIAIAVAVFLAREERPAVLFTLTGLAMLGVLFFTDWGVSSINPVVRVSWFWVVVASVGEVVSVWYWLMGGRR